MKYPDSAGYFEDWWDFPAGSSVLKLLDKPADGSCAGVIGRFIRVMIFFMTRRWIRGGY